MRVFLDGSFFQTKPKWQRQQQQQQQQQEQEQKQEQDKQDEQEEQEHEQQQAALEFVESFLESPNRKNVLESPSGTFTLTDDVGLGIVHGQLVFI